MAKDTPKVFRFSTRLETFHRSFTHTAIIVPEAIIEQLPSKGRIRTKGTINKTPFALAIQHRKDGARFFMVSAQLRREAKIQSGDPVKVEFWQVDPDLVDVPDELQAVIEQDADAMKLWKSFTPAMQRGLSHYVNSVKNVDSRIKRALELMEKAKYRQLHFQKVKKQKGE